jgi:EAL domain-containing protein (putative c-di-GMP-specific phosphodiesterase class I)
VTTERPRVLLVDDDPRILAGLRRQLYRQYDVVTADGGAEGLAVLHSQDPFAVVISDMRMPGMDGATFLAQVRASAPQTTRMLLTGQTELSTAIRAINDGQVFRFLDKPCPPEVLDRCLQEAVARHHAAHSEHQLLAGVLQDRRVMESTGTYEALTAGPQVGTGGGQFRLWYQPIVNFRSGRVAAVEAMLRGPEDGPAPHWPPWPGAAADNEALAMPLSRWVLAAACQEVASWPALGSADPLRTNVKMSAGQLRDPHFTDDLARTLILSGLEPGRVVLEICDGAVVEEEPVRRALCAVSAWGVHLTVVGSDGVLPLAAWAESVPITGLKIVGGCPLLGDPGLWTAAAEAGLHVTVEGVTTAADDALVRGTGCSSAQGSFYGRETDPSTLLATLGDLRI